MCELTNSERLLVASIITSAESRIQDAIGKDVTLAVQMVHKRDQLGEADEIISKCLQVWGVTLAYVREPTRKADRVAMRQVLLLIISEKCEKLTLRRLAQIVGLADHTTVLWALNKARYYAANPDRFFNQYYEPVKHLMNNEGTI